TISKRAWSSDVCSSDLTMGSYSALTFGPIVVALVAAVLIWWRTRAHGSVLPTGGLRRWTIVAAAVPLLVVTARQVLGFPLWALQIGRASWREGESREGR